MPFYRAISAILLLSSAASPVAAEEMSLKAAIEAVIASHPMLEISRIDQQISQSGIRRVEGMLDPTVTARIGGSEETTPTSSSFQPSETRLGTLTGSIAKPLESGGTLGANFNYSRTKQVYGSALATPTINPAYRNQINLNYRHPLLKGNGRPDYSQSLIASEVDVRSTNMQRLITARTLALNTTLAWFQLASDEINVRIARQATERAKELLNYQKKREEFGLIESADRLQAEALLATRNTDLQRANAHRAASLNNLNRLMLRTPGSDITLQRQASANIDMPDMQSAMRTAEQKRVELKLLQTQLEAAEARLVMARDKDSVQMDLVAEVGTRALNSAATDATLGGFSANDHYASLSVEVSEVLGRNTARADVHKAELQRQRIIAQRANTMKQIGDDIANALTSLNSGKPTLEAARKQAKAEDRKFTAEMRRYREGRADTATLVQFEGELRSAELSAELQALNLQLAGKQLLWAKGMLLESLQIEVE